MVHWKYCGVDHQANASLAGSDFESNAVVCPGLATFVFYGVVAIRHRIHCTQAEAGMILPTLDALSLCGPGVPQLFAKVHGRWADF